MATIAGPDVAVEPFSSRSRHSAHFADGPLVEDDEALLSSPHMSQRPPAPLPNPPFVFPLRHGSPSLGPPSPSRSSPRRPRSSRGPQDASDEDSGRPPALLALPDFSFPLAPNRAATPDQAFLSPPLSPASPRNATARGPAGHGHKRGGSEFVGGNIRSGDPITVTSTSPTKAESGLASPGLPPSKPPHRKTHAHRRSAAISSHDLSSIMLPTPSAALRGSSAPTSPASSAHNNTFTFSEHADVLGQPHSIVSPRSEGDIRKASAEAAAAASEDLRQRTSEQAHKNRVGFSDTLEYIPRPLSLVSNGTSSTVTARRGHSLSGSISSVISLSNPSILEGLSPVRNTLAVASADNRPSTADPVLERTLSSLEAGEVTQSPPRRNSTTFLPPTSQPVTLATPSPTKAPKRWSFFGLEPFSASHSPAPRSRPDSSSSVEAPANEAVAAPPAAEEAAPEPVAAESEAVPPPTAQGGVKKRKKQKKVKNWAGSILSRKAKAKVGKDKDQETHLSPDADVEDGRGHGSVEMALEPELPGGGDEEDWRSVEPTSPQDEDMSYPMIDLDAALGPFNTPLPRNPEWEAAQRAGGMAKRQLHSAAGMSRFTGPGMYYQHRRAESAPEMVPFEAVRFGIHRFGSSSTMADVFEEDEEDEDEDGSESSGQSTPMMETPAEPDEAPADEAPADPTFDSVAEQSQTGAAAAQSGVKRKGSDLGDDEKSQASSKMKSEHVASSQEEVGPEEAAVGEPRHSPAPVADAEGEAPCSPLELSSTGGEQVPVDVYAPLHLPAVAAATSLAPISPYSMTQSSSFPSPRSPVSYDTQRISTAPSSVADDNFQSLLLGEPGPEVRISTDLHSRASSHSTMTRDAIFSVSPQARQPPFYDHPRPASLTSAAFGRRRSSLASLSRLINTSHGERSKLSMEVTLGSNEAEKKRKASKTKRFSRLVQFWKPKDSLRA